MVGERGDVPRLESFLAERRPRDVPGGRLQGRALRPRRVPAGDRVVEGALPARPRGRRGQAARVPRLEPAVANDRTLVYSKGAYVFHLLREQLGEEKFWSGLRSYTRRFMWKSVTTPEFQKAMEEATGADLGEFFRRFVYTAEGS